MLGYSIISPHIIGFIIISSHMIGCMIINPHGANLDKPHDTAFHIRNKRSLEISSGTTDLENTDYPKYVGVTLDMPLSYNEHIQR